MMNPGKLARGVTFAVTSLYTIVLYLSHDSVKADAGRLLSYVPTVVGFGLILFDLWIWRFCLVHPFVGRPWVGGTWLGTVQPSPESRIPEGGNRGPIKAALVIEQTYWALSVTLMTAESASQSTSASLRPDMESAGRRVLAYTYANEPELKHQDRSPPHLGASRLRIVGRLPTEINGAYWTARLTAGDMKFNLVDRKVDYPTLDAVVTAATAMGSRTAAAREESAK